MQFVPYHLLGDTPNVIVDGMSNAATVCNLSHWPHSGTRQELKDDLSAQIVFHYLDCPDFRVNAEAVSNNHFDEDGLVSLYSILNPSAAYQQRELLIDIAGAGDFGTYRSSEAARIAFVLASYADKQQSPLKQEIFDQPYPEYTSALYRELLPLLPDMIDNLGKYRPYWEEENTFLKRSEKAIETGQIKIEEKREIDLAIVTLSEESSNEPPHKLPLGLNHACHSMAIHNGTGCFRILLMRGKQYQLYFRYETWVQYMSRRPLPRVNLAPLAHELSQEEGDRGRWLFTGVDKIDARLYLDGNSESRILPHEFRKKVESFLAKAPAAWDPYDP
jgi:hypothetical protein